MKTLSTLTFLLISTSLFADNYDLIKSSDFSGEEVMTYNSRPDLDSNSLVNKLGAEYNLKTALHSVSPALQGKIGFNVLNNISGDDIHDKMFQAYGDIGWQFSNGTTAKAGKFKLNTPIFTSKYDGNYIDTLYTGGIVSNIPAFSPNARAYIGYLSKQDSESAGDKSFIGKDKQNNGAFTIGMAYNQSGTLLRAQIMHIGSAVSQGYADSSALLDRNSRLEFQGWAQVDRTGLLQDNLNFSVGARYSYLVDAQNLVSLSHNQNNAVHPSEASDPTFARPMENFNTTLYADSFFLKSASANYLKTNRYPFAQESASKIEYKNVQGIFKGKISGAKYYSGGTGKLLETTVSEIDASATFDMKEFLKNSSVSALIAHIVYPNETTGDLQSANAFRITAGVKF